MVFFLVAWKATQLTEQIHHTEKPREGLSPGAHWQHWEWEETSASLGEPPSEAPAAEQGSSIYQFPQHF